MGKHVTFEEFHVIILAPPDLEDAACEAIQQVLESQRFQSALRRAIRHIIRQYPDLAPIRVRLSESPNRKACQSLELAAGDYWLRMLFCPTLTGRLLS